MNKKGMSPLVATVLLIFAAVILGILVMNWGRAQIEAGARCSVSTGMQVVEIGGVKQICYSRGENGFIEFTLENGVDIDVEKVHFRAIGAKSVYTRDLPDSKIEKGGALKQTVPYDSNMFGEIEQIKITPKVVLYPDEPMVSCDEQAILVENVKVC